MGPEANSCPSRDRDLVEVLGVAPACQRGARVVIRTIENADVKTRFGRDALAGIEHSNPHDDAGDDNDLVLSRRARLDVRSRRNATAKMVRLDPQSTDDVRTGREPGSAKPAAGVGAYQRLGREALGARRPWKTARGKHVHGTDEMYCRPRKGAAAFVNDKTGESPESCGILGRC
jgi:hypothetical protein